MLKQFNHVKTFPLPNLVNYDTENGRFYALPDGKYVPSVTTVLDHSKKHIIENWKQRVGEAEATKITDRAKARGTAVHAIVEKYLKNDPELFKDVAPDIKSAFYVMKPVIDLINDIYYIEQTLYSEKLQIAGRCDVICAFNGAYSIVDFKTSKKPKREDWIENYFVQATAYSVMLKELTHSTFHQLVIIMMVEDTNEVQVFVKNRKDYTEILNLRIAQFQETGITYVP